jgi:hypothetical protein
MRRWNDGDSIKVNYIGHPLEGAIAGYIEVQNDPRGRELQISRNRQYWNSRFRAFLWETAYSAYWEIGPTGETPIFNQGGFTYPIGCKPKGAACEATAKYTNNTGWVDFIITSIVCMCGRLAKHDRSLSVGSVGTTASPCVRNQNGARFIKPPGFLGEHSAWAFPRVA